MQNGENERGRVNSEYTYINMGKSHNNNKAITEYRHEKKKINIMRNCMLHGHGRCHELTMPASMISHKKQIATEIFGG